MLKYIIAIPVLIVLVAFALSNRENVNLHLWPTDYAVEVALSVAVLIAMGFGFLVGALMLWFSAVAAKGRARRAERARDRLQADLDALRARMVVPPKPATRASSGSTALVTTR
jgi:uncharacterized integral membrane protein